MKYISYRSEPNVNPESTTETFASGAFFVDSDRFRGVPFFFRTGKRLTEKGTHVNIVFKQMDSIFGEPLAPNILTIYIQPTEGFSLSLNGKQVGEEFNLAPNSLDYRTDATATGASPEPYEKLIYDVLNNNSTNFSHWDEVGASWKLIDRIEELWAEMVPHFMTIKLEAWDLKPALTYLKNSVPNGLGSQISPIVKMAV